MKHTVIAIDGPAASGKSSVACRLAGLLDWGYVNSGEIYRALTWYVLSRNADPADPAAVTDCIASAAVRTGFDGDTSFIRIDEQDATPRLRDESVNRAVSPVSRVSAVRELVFNHLHALAAERNTVVEGRDIGSVIFPFTPFKFYLDAPPDVRSRRRAAQGEIDPISLRDKQDSSRAAAPLRVAPDAVIVDTSDLDIDGVVDAILRNLAHRGIASPAASRRTASS
jgi:cytidylate kinase